jgi:hypothetical protein
MRTTSHVDVIDHAIVPPLDKSGITPENSQPATNASDLVKLVSREVDLWKTEDEVPYATVSIRKECGSRYSRNFAIESKEFHQWLGRRAYETFRRPLGQDMLKNCQQTLSSLAIYSGPKAKAYRRIANVSSDYYIDLCNEGAAAVRVNANGWAIVSDPPVRFIRTSAMRALPEPQCGGNVNDLWQLANIDANDRPLVLAWIIEAYRSDTPFPLLELTGQQGSAKSTTQKTLRSFIDPNDVPLRGRPKNVEDVYVSAGKGHLLSYENLSGLGADISDALCTVATGGGYASRQLYSNDGESLLKAHNPTVINGIEPMITRSDLLDRTIAISLPSITGRLTETEHQNRLISLSPKIFGSILDLFAKSLEILPTVTREATVGARMADFVLLGESISRAQGNPDGAFFELYSKHKLETSFRTLEANPTGLICLGYCDSGREFKGTIGALLQELQRFEKPLAGPSQLPSTPRALGSHLRRSIPDLRLHGVFLQVGSKPHRDGVHCELRALIKASSPNEEEG